MDFIQFLEHEGKIDSNTKKRIEEEKRNLNIRVGQLLISNHVFTKKELADELRNYLSYGDSNP